MEQNVHLTTWISLSTRERFALVARAQGVSESALLRRLVESSLLAVAGNDGQVLAQPETVGSSGRISVRLRADDLMLLRERAAARRLPTSTYVSYLVRGEVRMTAKDRIYRASRRSASMELLNWNRDSGVRDPNALHGHVQGNSELERARMAVIAGWRALADSLQKAGDYRLSKGVRTFAERIAERGRHDSELSQRRDPPARTR